MRYLNFNLSVEIAPDAFLSHNIPAELLTKMEDLILQAGLDLYNSEYELDAAEDSND